MLTLSWRKVGRSSALTLVLVVGLPALVEAQLFPNMWIKRKRDDCANEPPFYGHVRHDYFGYYPTCWRKFPDGWGCPGPNNELPDAAKEFARQPRDPVPEFAPEDIDIGRPVGGRGAAPAGGPDGGTGGARPLPDLPGAPSRGDRDLSSPDPFTTPTLPRSATPAAPNTPGRSATPPREAQPFDPVPAPLPRSSNDSGPLPRVSNLPSLEGPATDRQNTAMLGGPTLLDGEGADSTGAVLALPAMTSPNPRISGDSLVVSSMPPSLPSGGTYVESADSMPAPAPTQAPRRTSLIGSLFNRFRR
jgi:hypothetical protein